LCGDFRVVAVVLVGDGGELPGPVPKGSPGHGVVVVGAGLEGVEVDVGGLGGFTAGS
jgi:hypothetical protein